MRSTDDETARGLRDRPLGKLLIFALAIVAALVVARSCGKTETALSKEQAIEVARKEVAFAPTEQPLVRLLKRGLQSREVWLVGLERRGPDGNCEIAQSVLVDANTGAVLEVRANACP